MVELCVTNIDDIFYANTYTDRIELVTALEVGGVTPSMGLVLESLKYSTKPIAVMVRARAGNFYYTKKEIEVMFLDAKLFLDTSVESIVFGFLTKDRLIDVENTKKMIDLIHSKGKKAVFHRAIDDTNNYFEQVGILKELGIDRILTSGNKPNVDEGYENLIKLKNMYKDLVIVAGSGIRANNFNKFSEFERHSGFSKLSDNKSELYGTYIQTDENKLKEIKK